MHGEGVVNGGADAAGVEDLPHAVARGQPDDVKVVDAARPVQRRLDALNPAERRAVLVCDPPPRRVPSVEVPQLYPEDGRLHRIEAAVEADRSMLILFARAAVAQHRDPLGEIGPRRRHRPAVAGSAEVLGRIEAEAADIAEAAGAPAAIKGAVRLSRVLDHRQRMLCRDGGHCIHIGALPVEVHRDDRLRPRRDRGLDLAGIDQRIVMAHVDQHRPRAAERYGKCGRREGHGRDDHLVARAQPESTAGKLQRIGAAADAERMRHLAILGKRALEQAHLFAEDEVAAPEDLGDRPRDLRLEVATLRPEVDQRDRFLQNRSIVHRPDPVRRDHPSRASKAATHEFAADLVNIA